jgi:hypothetical protein
VTRDEGQATLLLENSTSSRDVSSQPASPPLTIPQQYRNWTETRQRWLINAAFDGGVMQGSQVLTRTHSHLPAQLDLLPNQTLCDEEGPSIR